MRAVILALISSSFIACIPPDKPVVVAPRGVSTSIEKTTVIVKDPQGNVMRIEEKEMVLQEYLASEPVELKTAKSPPVQVIRVERASSSSEQ